MFVRPLSTLSAEPILGLARNHARWTPLARLSIVYQIVPERPLPPPNALPRHPVAAGLGVVGRSDRGPLEVSQSLGQGLYLDSILMGGVDGEALPVTLDVNGPADTATQAELAAHLPGGLLDVNA
jgi:hypothetical protein